jgi:hypothetical protein
VQDRMNELVGHVELAPFADRAEVLAAAIKEFEKRGWLIEEAPRLSTIGFFCNREGVRWFVHIVRFNPARNPSHSRSKPSQRATRTHP